MLGKVALSDTWRLVHGIIYAVDPESAERALEIMNGFILAGRQLKVARPLNKDPPLPSAVPGSRYLMAESLTQAAAVAHDVNNFFQLADVQKMSGWVQEMDGLFLMGLVCPLLVGVEGI